MPIPKPNKDEKKPDFISRCMGDEVMNKDYPEQDQRSAICYKAWDTEENIKRDEKGRIIVAENVKFIINARIEVDKNGKTSN